MFQGVIIEPSISMKALIEVCQSARDDGVFRATVVGDELLLGAAYWLFLMLSLGKSVRVEVVCLIFH